MMLFTLILNLIVVIVSIVNFIQGYKYLEGWIVAFIFWLAGIIVTLCSPTFNMANHYNFRSNGVDKDSFKALKAIMFAWPICLMLLIGCSGLAYFGMYISIFYARFINSSIAIFMLFGLFNQLAIHVLVKKHNLYKR